MTRKNEFQTNESQKTQTVEEKNDAFVEDLSAALTNMIDLIEAGHEVIGYVLSVSYNIHDTKEPRVAFNLTGPINRVLLDVGLGVDDAREKLVLLRGQSGTKQ